MRILSPAAQAILAQGQGLEPVNLVQVFWTSTVSTVYADRKFEQAGIVGRLLELSNLESVVNITKASNTSAITVKLDDSDGSIKNVFDNVDIIKKTVYVFQWFTQLPISDAFIVFEGQISSPISWKEGERTITFDVLSKIEDLQYGFSADEGDFQYIPQGLVGQAWPLPFGTVFEIPSLKLYDLPNGILQNSTTGRTTNTPSRRDNQINSYNDAFNKYNECIQKALHCFAQADQLQFDGVPATQVFVLPSLAATTQTANTATDQWNLKAQEYQDQAEQYRQQFMNILRDMNTQATHDDALDSQLTVQNGNTFPQGVDTQLQVGNTTYTGQFSGNIFTVFSATNPFATDGSLLAGPLTINDQDVATQYSAQVNEQNFFYNVAGTAAISSGALSYIVCLFQVQVTAVLAKYGGLTTVVPSNLYQVSYVNFGPIAATYITIPKALSLVDSKWDDSIFCNVISPVGPNVVDILEWLILNYTSHSFDTTSFATVRAQINSYPANFVLTKQGNIIKLLQEIAFQARCALWYKQGLFYIKLLAEMSTSVDTITETDIEFGTMEVSCTPTEELITKYTATYTLTANTPGNDLVIWYFNMQKYGLLEKTDNFYIYNSPELVERCSMFWLVRYTNTWKRLKISAFLSKLKLETFDYVFINFSRPWIANGPVIGMVETCLYDSADNRVELTIWLPIRFGEMTTYPFAAPYAIDPTLIFPQTLEQANASSGNNNNQAQGQLIPPNKTNAPPARKNPSVANSGGQINPSDDGFTPVTAEASYDPTAFNNKSNTAGSKPSTQYTIKPIKNPDLSFDAPGTWPGIVQTQSAGNDYNVDVYFAGLTGDVTTVAPVTQIRIHEDDIIPEGTPVMVTRNRILVSTDRQTGLSIFRSEYTMQVPVWLKGSSTATASPPDVPPSDPGTEGDFSGDTGASGEGDFGDGGDEGSGDEPLGDF